MPEWIEATAGVIAVLVGLVLLTVSAVRMARSMFSGAETPSGVAHAAVIGLVCLVFPQASTLSVEAFGAKASMERLRQEKTEIQKQKTILEDEWSELVRKVGQLEKDVAKASPAPTTSAPAAPSCPSDPEAEGNIRWVFADAGANRRYAALRSRGESVFTALLGAQSHNAGATASIQRYGQACAEAYARRVGAQ
jgi:hypothetical protein